MRLSYRQMTEQLLWAFQKEKKRLLFFGVGVPFAIAVALRLGQFLPQQWMALPLVAEVVSSLILLPVFLRLPCGLLTFSSLREQRIERGTLAGRVRRLVLPIVLFELLDRLLIELYNLLYLLFLQGASSPEEHLLQSVVVPFVLLLLLPVMGAASYFAVYFYGCLTRYEGNFRETLRVTWQTVTTRPGGRIWAEIKFAGPLILLRVILGRMGEGLPVPLLLVLVLLTQVLFLLQIMAECVILQAFTKKGLPRISKRKRRRLAEQNGKNPSPRESCRPRL